MSDAPPKDRRLLSRSELGDGRFVPTYNPHVALQILEDIALGKTLKSICARDDRPSQSTFHRWVVLQPELAKAYNEARRLSAQSFEDEALDAAREVKQDPGDSARVRAVEVMLNQLRWSSSKRDPGRFGERNNVSLQIPIQINTGLNLGKTPEAGSGGDNPNIYTITAELRGPEQDLLGNPDTSRPLLDPTPQRTGRIAKRVLRPRMPADLRPFKEQVLNPQPTGGDSASQQTVSE